MTIVIPSALSWRNTSITSFDVLESRAPVGSSARMSDGLVAAGEFARQMVSTVGKPHTFELLHGKHVALTARYSLIEQRQGHILHRIFIADEIERLKYESYKFVAEFGGAVLAEVAYLYPVKIVFAGIICVKNAYDIQQSRLSGAGSTHYRNEFATVDGQIYILENVERNGSGISLVDVFKIYNHLLGCDFVIMITDETAAL